jgi:radical SAM modification target selenobiotic family peptide
MKKEELKKILAGFSIVGLLSGVGITFAAGPSGKSG